MEMVPLQIQDTGSWQTGGEMEVTVTRRRMTVVVRDVMLHGDVRMFSLGLEDVELVEVGKVVVEVAVVEEEEVGEVVTAQEITTDGVNLTEGEIKTVGNLTPETEDPEEEDETDLEEAAGEAEEGREEDERTELITSSRTCGAMLTWSEAKIATTPATGTPRTPPNILNPSLRATSQGRPTVTMEAVEVT